MKKLTTLFLLIILGITATAQNGRIDLRSKSKAEAITSDFSRIKAVFSYESIVSSAIESPRGTFSRIALHNTYPSGEIGTPELPATHELLAVPFGANPRVRVTSFSTTDYRLSDFGINTIVPHQPSVRKDQDPSEVEFAYQAAAYQKRGLHSAPEVSIEVQGTMRGIRIGSLVVNPISYDPTNGILRVFNDIEVEVNFEGADLEETERMLVATYSPYFDIVYKQMFNYRAILDVYDDHPDLWAAPVRMIVVANDMFESTLQPWIEWKTQKGFYMDVNYTSAVGTTSAAIKTFIQNKYNTGVQNNQTPTFVVIVGDKAQVPESAIGSSSHKVTDLYYGSVDNDYYPDMFYSRMSAENTQQLTAIINKILQYEQYTMPDPSYLNNVLLIAGADNHWNPIVGQPTINYATTYYYNTEHGFSNVYAYLNSYAGCYNNLSTGVGFANYTAHGSETSWYSPSFTVSNVNSLTNNDKYFLAMGNCCVAANWGYSQPCFGEAMIRAENKAAYSYIGSCPNTYWNEDYYFGVGATNTHGGATPSNTESSTGVYDGVWMDDTYNTVSSMVFVGNLAVSYAHAGNYQTHSSPIYYWQAYHVLGDGSIMPYRVQPSSNTVSHAQTFPAGATSFTVNAQAGSYVGISRNNVLLGAALVPASGSVNVSVTPVTSGQVKIVVTKPQRQPYIQTISVGSVNGPNIIVEQVTPNTIENGVNQPLNVTMKNTGNAATTGNTTVTIASNDAYLSIIDGSATFGPMAANGGTVNVNSAFTVKAAENTPNNHVFSIQATATNGASSWNSTFTLTSFINCQAPTNLSATAQGETSIVLNWTASATATSYRIFRGNNMIANDITATNYTDNNLTPGTQYCYTVKSNCADGNISDPSNEACATTQTPCNAPTNLSATVQGYTNIVLNWTASPTATGYRVFRENTMIANNVTATSYTDENLPEGHYCYTVRSICPNGESDPSNQSCADIAMPCDEPRNLDANYIFNSSDDFGVMVEWDAPAAKEETGLIKFNVYRSNDGNSYDRIAQVDFSGETHYNYFDKVEAGRYFYQLKALYQWGEATCESKPAHALNNPASNCVMVEVTSINELSDATQIYPNPASNRVQVKAAEDITQLNVYNIMGVKVFSTQNCGKQTEIDVTELPNGTYFINIITPLSNKTTSFVKQ